MTNCTQLQVPGLLNYRLPNPGAQYNGQNREVGHLVNSFCFIGMIHIIANKVHFSP